MRVDYSKHNYCRQCAVKTTKDINICPECHYMMRVTAHNKLSKYPTSYRQEYKVKRYQKQIEMPRYSLYEKYNICIICNIRHPKDVFKCTQCHKKIRVGPRHIYTLKKPEWKGYQQLVCKGLCLREDFVAKYNIIKSVSQKYRRIDKTNFRLPDRWHWCTGCSRFYQGPDFCPCCHIKTRSVSRQKRTTAQQIAYLKTMPEHAIKFKPFAPHGIKDDIMKDLDKWNKILNQ